MHRSSIKLIGGVCGRASTPRMLIRRHIAFNQKKGFVKSSGNRRTLGSGKNDVNPENRVTISSAEALKRDMAGPRRVVREDNMWADPKYLDTRWLRPRDPRRYKPDFGQTEPHSLRVQFMRSPDERTRNAMGRDWEMVMRLAANTRRQSNVANPKQEQTRVNMKSKKNLGPAQD